MSRYLAAVLTLLGFVIWGKLMDGGAFVYGFIAEGIKRLRQKRRRKRRLRELGIEGGSMATLDLGTRTSTNAFVGGGLFSQIYIQLVALLPGQGALESLLLTPEAVAFAAVLCAALVARISKTPVQPGAL